MISLDWQTVKRATATGLRVRRWPSRRYMARLRAELAQADANAARWRRQAADLESFRVLAIDASDALQKAAKRAQPSDQSAD